MESFLQNTNIWVLIISIIWVLPWKGYALWMASKNNHKIWFIIILIINTFALLEIFYIFYIIKKKPSEILNAIKSTLAIKNRP